MAADSVKMPLQWTGNANHKPSLLCHLTVATASSTAQPRFKVHAAKQSSGAHQKQKQVRKKSQKPLQQEQEQQQAAIEVRRSDLAYRAPPWHLSYKATAEQLQTAEDIWEVAAEVSFRLIV